MFKTKISDAIKRLFPGINLSKKRLEKIVTAIEKKVIDDEAKIDDAVRAYDADFSLADIAKDDDTLRNANAEIRTLKDGNNKDGGKDGGAAADGKPAEHADDVPVWAKTLIDTNKALVTKIETLEKAQSTKSTMERLTADLKDIPGLVWNERVMPTNEEEYTAFIEKVKTQYGEAEKAGQTAALKSLGNPGGAGPAAKQQVQTKDDGKVSAVLEKTMGAGAKGALVAGSQIGIGAKGFTINGGLAPTQVIKEK